MKEGRCSMKGKKIITVIIFFIFFLLPSNGYSAPDQLLQSRLDAVPEGGTLTLPPGEYVGPIVINNSITLKGEKGAVIIGNGTGDVLTVKGRNVTVEGLKIKKGGHNSRDGDALIRVEADAVVLKNNHTEDGYYGIHLVRCSNAQVVGNVIEGKEHDAIADRGNGIQVTYGGNHLLKNNQIKYVQDGIYYDNTTGIQTEHNQVEYSRYGYHLMFSQKINLVENRTFNSVVGSMVMDAEEVQIKSNVFQGQRDPRGFGLFIYETKNCEIEDNILSDNTTGIACDGAINTLIYNNKVFGNDMGVKRVGEVVNSYFTGNSFIANVRQVGGKKVWPEETWHKDQKGNFWDDYQGLDLNQDGVGDSAYRMSDAMVRLMDLDPILSIFYGSPVQQLLEWIGKDQRVIDPYPLKIPIKK